MKQNPESTSFGTKSVTPDEKTNLVLGVFDNVATRYDIMNDVMSGGVHRLWKDKFVSLINPQPHHKILDVAGGTGDIAFRIRKATSHDTHITVSDINPAMLEVGRARAQDKGFISGFDWVEANAESLPFEDNSFDVYTIAFGLRNVTHIDTALKEAARVLKPGGRFFCLEFSHVEHPFIGKIYDAYSEHVIPKMGEVIAKDRDSYQYLVESIRKFPKPRALETRMKAAGFSKTRSKAMSLGVVCVHEGWKA